MQYIPTSPFCFVELMDAPIALPSLLTLAEADISVSRYA